MPYDVCGEKRGGDSGPTTGPGGDQERKRGLTGGKKRTKSEMPVLTGIKNVEE